MKPFLPGHHNKSKIFDIFLTIRHSFRLLKIWFPEWSITNQLKFLNNCPCKTLHQIRDRLHVRLHNKTAIPINIIQASSSARHKACHKKKRFARLTAAKLPKTFQEIRCKQPKNYKYINCLRFTNSNEKKMPYPFSGCQLLGPSCLFPLSRDVFLFPCLAYSACSCRGTNVYLELCQVQCLKIDVLTSHTTARAIDKCLEML